MKDNYGCVNCKHLVSCEPNPFGICEEYEPSEKKSEEKKNE